VLGAAYAAWFGATHERRIERHQLELSAIRPDPSQGGANVGFGRLRPVLAAAVVVAGAAACAPTKPPAPPHEPGVAPFTVGGEHVVYDDATLGALNLDGWPDGELGVERVGGGYSFHAAKGGGVQTRSDGSLDAPAQLGTQQPVSITGVPTGISYAAGGPVFTDALTGIKLMFTHIERWRDPIGANFYGTIGLSRSTDGGASWTFLGEIFRHAAPPDQCLSEGVDSGSGTYAVRNEGGRAYLYLYVHDRQDCGHINSLAVVRAPIDEVVLGALLGVPSNWSKYRNGSWTEPGVGGASSDIWPDSLPWTFNFGSVSWNTYLGEYTLVITRPHSGLLGNKLWKLEMLGSLDGLTWSAPRVLLESPIELVYPTIVGLDDPRQSGQSFYVYYVASLYGPNARWTSASLMRRTVTFG
jgi:hypothetical protein